MRNASNAAEARVAIKSGVSGLLVVALVMSVHYFVVETGVACNERSLTVAVSPEKYNELSEIAEDFNERFCGTGGTVEVFPDGSGSALDGLAGQWDSQLHGGHGYPDVWSPASSAWSEILRAADPAKIKNWTAAGLPSIARTPVVFAQVTYGDRSTRSSRARSNVNVSDFLGPSALTRSETVVRTNPRISTVGLDSFLEAFTASAGLSEPDQLKPSMIDDENVRRRVSQIEDAKIGAGETTNSYLCSLAGSDKPTSTRIVPLEEKSVIDFNRGKIFNAQNLECPRIDPTVRLSPIYPSDGSLVSDSPYAIITDDLEKQEKAAGFLAYITSEGQSVLQAAGFRSLQDGELEYGATTDLAPIPGQWVPQTVKERRIPDGSVLKKLRETWERIRRPMLVTFMVDTSGSMKCSVTSKSENCDPEASDSRMAAVRKAIAEAWETAAQGSVFSEHDRIGVATFGGSRCDFGKPAQFSRQSLDKVLRELLAPGGETPLYRCLATVQGDLKEFTGDGRTYLRCVILLSDGRNDTPDHPAMRQGKYVEDELPEDVEKALAEAYTDGGVHLFPVAFGANAPEQTLRRMAKMTDGEIYLANGIEGSTTGPESIERILRSLVNNL